MGKRKRGKSQKRRSRRQHKRQNGPVFIKDPLAGIPQEQLRSALIAHAKEAKVDFENNLDAISEVLRSCEPLQTIALLASYGLFCTVNDDGKWTSFLKEGCFTQAHVELVQALSLSIPFNGVPFTPPTSAVIQKLFDLLPKLGDQFADQRMVAMEQERSDEQKAILMVQESLRLHTQSVRNWGYFDAVQRIVESLYKPLDSAFASHVGLSATQLIAAFVGLIRDSEQKFRDWAEQVQQVFSERTAAGMIRKYYALNPEFTDVPDDMIAFAKKERLKLAQVKTLILSHSEFRLTGIYTFTAETIASRLGVSQEVVAQIFDALSHAFGDLAGQQPEQFLLDNPVWRRPAIRLGEGQYFCAIPQVFFSFVFRVLDELTTGNEALKRKCKDRRAEFLETELEHLFEHSFPGSELVANFKWRDGNAEYENDLLVRVDSNLFIIEAKSGAVSLPALRGAPERAKKHIRELLIAPSLQSARLADRIKAVLQSPERRESLLPDLDMRLDLVRTVLRLSVTLKDFAMIQANLGELRGTGWLPVEHRVAPCILLADLEVIFDILEPAGQKIHYLRRRTELAERLHMRGDELDHLGLYLGTCFNIGEVEFDGAAMQLIEMSEAIDDFCIARSEGIQVEKPRLRLGKWWSDILAQVERRRFPRWTDAYNMLLSLSPEEQEEAERKFDQLANGLRKGLAKYAHKDCVLIIPTPRKSVAVALYASPEASSGQRRAKMEAVAGRAFEHSNVEQCIVVARNIQREVYPYSALSIFCRNEAQQTIEDLLIY